MAQASVVLLWHMHQPCYVDPLEGESLMPWVRLHAVKGYFDMIHAANAVPEMRCAFNFTPVLVQQILGLRDRTVADRWLEWSLKPAQELSLQERVWLLEHFFKANWDNLIKPLPRYWELLSKRGTDFPKARRESIAGSFSVQEMRDLQTLFNLAWCGYAARKFHPEIEELRQQGRGYTEEEKLSVLEIHHKILGRLLDDYREAEAAGRIETTTTPFYHPIMPLVYDTDFAVRCMHGRVLPNRFSAPEDVQAQLALALRQHEQVFGKRPKGLWPSEGAIAPELVPLMAEAGIEYFFTDEGNLFKGLERDTDWKDKSVDHLELFQGWRVEHGEASVNALFRERPLSDFIGFNAARNSPEAAAAHLIHHLAHIAEVADREDAVITLVLDGENAWECFPDGGEKFLNLFYSQLCEHPVLRPVLPGHYFEEHLPKVITTRLHTGSWIGSDFDIWVGDPEENQGWELVRETRAFLAENEFTVGDQDREAAWRSIYAAEGSDWFWWYGPDFSTDCDLLFDELFRSHLKNVYRCLDRQPPASLDVPVCKTGEALSLTPPSSLITPDINGRVSSYFEYYGAGSFDPAQQGSAMFQSDRLLRMLWFGNDEEHLYFRLDFRKPFAGEIRFNFSLPRDVSLTVRMAPGLDESEARLRVLGGDEVPVPVQSCLGDVLEFGCQLSVLGFLLGEQVGMFLQIIRDGIEVERHPERGVVSYPTLDPERPTENWWI